MIPPTMPCTWLCGNWMSWSAPSTEVYSKIGWAKALLTPGVKTPTLLVPLLIDALRAAT